MENNIDIGLIAHELQLHYPFLVTGNKNDDALQSVNYIGLIGNYNVDILLITLYPTAIVSIA